MFCSKCLIPVTSKDLTTIDLIRNEYLKDTIPWYIGYSGGKDSSTVLTLVINALHNIKEFKREITVIYCDTGVENPTITKYVYETIKLLKNECALLKIPIKFKIAKPEIKDRFFVKVIGKGYPTPTNKFRWCTDSLRINPVQKIINSKSEAVILLGVRLGESFERDKTISKHAIAEDFYLKQGTSKSKIIFAPILNYSVNDIWSSLKFKTLPASINHEIIGKLYKDAGSECPVYRESKGAPCGKGRFGCWTCTVVRRDKSTEKMIENGHTDLSPLFEFRNWISEFRNNAEFRCKTRRNGKIGLGPITLEGRKIILTKLLRLEKTTSMKFLTKEELELIHSYWDVDLKNAKYFEYVKLEGSNKLTHTFQPRYQKTNFNNTRF